MRYSIEPRDVKGYVKPMDFYLLLSIVKNLLTMLKNLQQMQ